MNNIRGGSLLVTLIVIFFMSYQSSSNELEKSIQRVKEEIQSDIQGVDTIFNFIINTPVLEGSVRFQSYGQLDLILKKMMRENVYVKDFFLLQDGETLHSVHEYYDDSFDVSLYVPLLNNGNGFLIVGHDLLSVQRPLGTKQIAVLRWDLGSLLTEKLSKYNLTDVKLVEKSMAFKDKFDFDFQTHVWSRMLYFLDYLKMNIILISSLVVCVSILFVFVLKIFVSPFLMIVKYLQNISTGELKEINLGRFNFLFRRYINAILEANQTIRESNNRLKMIEIEKHKYEIASQIIHDIRSPLAALGAVQGYMAGPEDVKIIFRESLKRITDISNGISLRNISETKLKVDSYHIYGLVNSIISEKRLEFKDSVYIDYLEANPDIKSIFVTIDVLDFKRVLSNLINNAAESYPVARRDKKVTVHIERDFNYCIIKITDEGKGIPEHILALLGKEQITFNKEKGSGLGLKHAFRVIEEHKGKIEIESSSLGTVITIRLPITETPSWYLPKLNIQTSIKNVFIIDDDVVIHGIWKRRFKKFPHIALTHFYNPESFIEDLNAKNLYENHRAIILCDFEFHNSSKNGIQITRELTHKDAFFIVSSYFDDNNFIQKLSEENLTMIPKFLAHDIDIVFKD